MLLLLLGFFPEQYKHIDCISGNKIVCRNVLNDQKRIVISSVDNSKPFNYYEYSELDGSNDRFMRKQKNTNQLSDPIFDKLFSNDTDADNNEENTLF